MLPVPTTFERAAVEDHGGFHDALNAALMKPLDGPNVLLRDHGSLDDARRHGHLGGAPREDVLGRTGGAGYIERSRH